MDMENCLDTAVTGFEFTRDLLLVIIVFTIALPFFLVGCLVKLFKK